MPYFSIILPVYNVAPYLERCIESILVQDFKDYEIILVDDGSSDASSQICDRYAENNPAIRVIHKANGGLSSARNAGFALAEGEYIWWVDSDDWVERDALAELYRASCVDRPDIVKFSHIYWMPERKTVISSIEPGMYTGAESIENLLNTALYSSGKYLLSAWGHIYKRDFLKRNNLSFVSERIIGSEDYLFNLSVLPYASAVCVLSAQLYNYELREGSLSKRYKNNLAGRYEELYRLLTAEHQKAGCFDRYRDGVNFFFVWHLIRGIGILNEYCVSKEHSIADGRKKVRAILRSKELRNALKYIDTARLTKKQRIPFLAMKWKAEFYFFFVYVLKPSYKRTL